MMEIQSAVITVVTITAVTAIVIEINVAKPIYKMDSGAIRSSFLY